ncbi:MAG TPA: hypothetical protein VJX74_03675 [Blastocatellia bacterium]|nr:hypothetical protein [Blastocatellia bacterium]
MVTIEFRAIINTYSNCCVRKKIARINISSYDVVINQAQSLRSPQEVAL